MHVLCARGTCWFEEKGLKRPSLVLRRSNKSIGAGKRKVSSSPGRVGGMARPIRVAKLFSPFGLSSTDLFPFIVMVFWYILLNLPCQSISIKNSKLLLKIERMVH